MIKMQTTELITLEGIGYRAVASDYVMKRAYALSDTSFPDLPAALKEIAETISERFGANLIEGEVTVYYPTSSKDPYVFGIPCTKNTKKKVNQVNKEDPLAIIKSRPFRPEVKGNTLQQDFEDALFEDKARPISATNKTPDGIYTNPIIQAQWEGFKLYHSKFDKDLSKRQDKTLGRYVIGKVIVSGQVKFHELPFRHPTKATAMEEANRLANTYGGGFGVFRCIEIVNKDGSSN